MKPALAAVITLSALLTGCGGAEPPKTPGAIPAPLGGGEARKLGDAAFDEGRKLGPYAARFQAIGEYSVWQGRHYLVRSRLDDAETLKVVQEMDRFYDRVWAWTDLERYRPGSHPPLPVCLLSKDELKREIYQGGPVYMPAERTLFAAFDAEAGNWSGLFHEGTHQALHLVYDFEDFPPWLNEGIANNVGRNGRNGVDGYDPKAIHEKHARSAKRALEKGPAEFHRAEAHARGWALVHWLWQADAERRYRRWMDLLADGKRIPEGEIKAAETALKDWLPGLPER